MAPERELGSCLRSAYEISTVSLSVNTVPSVFDASAVVVIVLDVSPR